MGAEAISWIVWLKHDVLIHAPLVLLAMCPFLILVGAVLSPFRGRPYRVAALFVLGLGTASLFFAIPTFQAVDPAIRANATSSAVLWICHSFITESRVIFIGLTLIYIAVLLLPEMLRLRENRLFSTVLPLSFLVLYSAGAMFLIQTANSAAAVTQRLGVSATEKNAPGNSKGLGANEGNPGSRVLHSEADEQ